MTYNQALQLDPEISERTSHYGRLGPDVIPGRTGAHFNTCWQGSTAQSGTPTASLQYLRRGMEEGYKGDSMM